jgi:hypothetical protein
MRRIHVSENLQFTTTDVGSIVFDQAIYHIGDTATAQWSVINAGDAASQDNEPCVVSVTDPAGADTVANPDTVGIPALMPGQATDTLTTQFQVTMATSPTALYTIVLSLPNGESVQNTCTVSDT